MHISSMNATEGMYIARARWKGEDGPWSCKAKTVELFCACVPCEALVVIRRHPINALNFWKTSRIMGFGRVSVVLLVWAVKVLLAGVSSYDVPNRALLQTCVGREKAGSYD